MAVQGPDDQRADVAAEMLLPIDFLQHKRLLAEAGITELPSSEDTETRLAAVRSDIEGHRRIREAVKGEELWGRFGL